MNTVRRPHQLSPVDQPTSGAGFGVATVGKATLNVVLFGIVVPVPSAVLYSNTILQDSRHEWVGVPIVVMTDWENEWS